MLNRKFFDNLRQQQALSGRVDEPAAATGGATASRTNGKDQQQQQQQHNGSSGKVETPDAGSATPGFVSTSFVCLYVLHVLL